MGLAASPESHSWIVRYGNKGTVVLDLSPPPPPPPPSPHRIRIQAEDKAFCRRCFSGENGRPLLICITVRLCS